MATLDKFGVPLNGTKLGILHPKQSYRFRVVLNGFGNGINLREMTQNVMTVGRPTPTFADVDLHSYNSHAKIAGKASWGDIELKLRDDINSSVASAVGAQLQKQFNFFEQTSAVSGANYKFSMELHVLDGTDNEAMEEWFCEGCYLSSVGYGDHDYSSSDPMEVTLTIKIDNATQIAGPNNNGGHVQAGDPMPNLPSPTGKSNFA